MGNRSPLPVRNQIVRNPSGRMPDGSPDPNAYTMEDIWIEALERFGRVLDATPVTKGFASLDAQADDIDPTDLSGGGLLGGVYRFSYYMHVTQAATTSSALELTFQWVDAGVTQTYTSPNVTGNSTTSGASLSFLIHCDSNTPINYSVAYTSVGAVSMQYGIHLVLESVPGVVA